MSYVPTGWTLTGDHTMDGVTLDHEMNVEVLDGPRLTAMRQLANAWEWREGFGQGGHNPYRHDDGLVPVYRGRGGGQPEFYLVTLRGKSTNRWYVVKCDPQWVTAKEMNRLTGRPVPRRTQPNPSGVGRYEIPYLWLEPLELYMDSDVRSSGDDDDEADLALEHARRWAQELRDYWAMDEEGWGSDAYWASSQELLVDPHMIGTLRRAQHDDDGQGQLDEVLARVAELDGRRREADTL